ncbi:MAG: cytochrome c oxidase subunit II [Anaerolineae bacterium]|nr:cytochrome c oxidase subunit II [Anaerolineae bacterium]
MRHFVIVGILILVVASLTYIGLVAAELLPTQASAEAISIDWLLNLNAIAISFLFALILVPLFYSLIVFRRKKGDTSEGEHMVGNTKLEITWTVIPLIVVVIFAYLGTYSLAEISRVNPQALEIKVLAQQFSFSFEYPAFGIKSKDFYVPVNKQFVLKMESRDVIHSFWVPEFRVKQDIVPGRVTELRITPILLTPPGEPYRVVCAELCGASHAYMFSSVHVVSQEDFDEWVAELQNIAAATDQTPEGRGEALSAQNGCLGCHSIDGSQSIAPTWFKLFGSSVELTDGTTANADEDYLAESILLPGEKIVAGYETTLMPSMEQLNEDQIADIIAYIKTLK